MFLFPSPAAAITEQAEAGKPAGVDEDPAAAGLIKRKSGVALAGGKGLQDAFYFSPPLRHDFTKRLAGSEETCRPVIFMTQP